MGNGTCETCEHEESGCLLSRKGGECSNMWQPKKEEDNIFSLFGELRQASLEKPFSPERANDAIEAIHKFLADKDAQLSEKDAEIERLITDIDNLINKAIKDSRGGKAEIEDLKAQIMGGCRECESKIQPELARLRRVEEAVSMTIEHYRNLFGDKPLPTIISYLESAYDALKED